MSVLPPELRGRAWPATEVISLDGAADTPFGADDFVTVDAIARGGWGDPTLVLGLLRDGRWACVVAADHWALVVATRRDLLWWGALGDGDRARLGAARREVASRLGCARCEHVAPHRPCGHRDPVTEERCGCTAWTPIPAALTGRLWAEALATVGIDRAAVERVVYGEPVHVLVLLDGTWLCLRAVRSGLRLSRARGFEEIWWDVLDDPERERLCLWLEPEHAPLGLVWLDDQLGAEDAEIAARAQALIDRLRTSRRA